MKRFLLPVILLSFLILRFVLSNSSGYETRVDHISLFIAFLVIIMIALFLIKRHKIHLKKEFQTIAAFKTNTKEFNKSMIVFFVFPIASILFMNFVLTPSFTMIINQVNSGAKRHITTKKLKVIKVYHSNGSRKKYYVDFSYDGENRTLKVDRKASEIIEKTKTIEGFSKGKLGFYFVK